MTSFWDEALAPFADRLATPIGRTERALYRAGVLETPVDNLITDALLEAADVDIAVSNGFRFGPPRPAGEVTEADLWNWLPFEAPVKRGTVKGQPIRASLEQEIAHVCTAPAIWRGRPGRSVAEVVDPLDVDIN